MPDEKDRVYAEAGNLRKETSRNGQKRTANGAQHAQAVTRARPEAAEDSGDQLEEETRDEDLQSIGQVDSSR